jgi:hypothetical protein
MHGDFSRGHRPDAKRGKSYTRGFAQQRRLLLDSDLNAMTDALHERLRALSRHTACPKGSPDLGYLVTPGRLLALFRDLDGVVTATSKLTVYRDYSRKYLDRYPSLALDADQGVAGSATVRLREAANGPTTFWCRADVATTVTLSGGVALNVPANANLQPMTVNLVNVQNLQINLDNGESVWIGLIERQQTATLAPRFDFAAGHYYLDGLPLFNPSDATWASNRVPPLAPNNFQVASPLRNLAANDRLLVYLEGVERHVTAVEDLGILEKALGGDSDTTTRGRAVGKVKLAWVPPALIAPGFDPERFGRALDNPVLTDGRLDVTTPPAPPDPDPCALPVQGGYTGSDNRFYRFEVHAGGALGTALFKWSRDNGAELFPVVDAPTNQTLIFPANTLLRPGDLVEILTADSIEEGDAAPATLNAGTGSFTPAVRAVGRLARLQAANSGGTGVAFSLRDPANAAVVTLAAHFGPFPSSLLKVRRWHGLIQTTVAPAPNVVKVENGIEVSLSGTFTAGDYWQYEARAAAANANGAFQTAPHGPERDYAPLALMRFSGAGQPLLLERWLDDRFPPLCELSADDIAFDGDRIGTDSDTVQEVIEELWERGNGGCCEFTIRETEGDTAQAIRDILDATVGEVTICFEPGIYNFATSLDIDDRKVTLKGCPRAVLAAAAGVNVMLTVSGTGRLALEELILFSRQTGTPSRVLVDLLGTNSDLEARAVGFFIVASGAAGALPTIAIREGDEAPGVVDPLNPVFLPFNFPADQKHTVRLDRCVGSAGWMISARMLNGLEVTGSFFSCGRGGVWAQRLQNVKIRGTDIIAGVNQPAGITPESLLADADKVAESLQNVVGNPIPSNASICLRTGVLAFANVTDCRLIAEIGMAALWTITATFQGNEYVVSNQGLYLFLAGEVTISGEWILGVGANAAFGIYWWLAAAGCSLTDCLIKNFRVGVAVGIERAGANQQSFVNVQIQNNQIVESETGVQVGSSDGANNLAVFRHIAITENVVTATAIGILINANPAKDATGASSRIKQVRVADNEVTARMCIGVIGSQIEVSDNSLSLPGGAGARFGVLAYNTALLVCESNQVELRNAANAENLSFAAPLTPEAAARAGVFGHFLAGAGVPSAALQIVDGGGARVAENSTQAENIGSLISLQAEDHPQLAVKGNDFRSGPVRGDNLDDVVFLSNTVLGPITIDDSTGGMVCDNRVRRRGDVLGHILISGASGNWKLADNQADGDIQIQPRLQNFLRPGGPLIFTGGAIGRRASALVPIHALAALANDQEFNRIALTHGTASGIVAPPAAPSAGVTTAVKGAPGNVALAVNNPDWRAQYAVGIREFIASGARASVVEAAGNLGVAAAVGFRTEEEYQVQCTANWSRNLTIGNSGFLILTNLQTTVQAIGNRADNGINISSYRRLVATMNVAHVYSANVGNQTAAIPQPNLQI